MKQKHFLACTAFLTAMAMAPMASAAPVTPAYDSFGSLPAATFGGSGIPNDAVAIGTFKSTDRRGRNPGTITLGLTAHQRYGNPPLGNDGAGTFFADPGMNDGLVPGNKPQGALWNFAWYVSGNNLSAYSFQLLYDTDAGAGTDESLLGSSNPVSFFDLLFGVSQDSQNLNFAMFGNSFDPMAEGEYSFVLRAIRGGQEAGRVAINVVVGQPSEVPIPGAAALFGIGLLGVGFSGRQKTRRSQKP
jgi:hypothetical protein